VLNIGRLRPGGAEYYVGEIATSGEDYYVGHGEAPGRWVGSLAGEIGLEGEVEPDHFRSLLEGRHPFTGEWLVMGNREVALASYVSEAEDAWLTTEQASRQLRCSERYVRRLLRAGALVGEKATSESTGHLGWRVRRSEVNRRAATTTKARSRPGFDVTLRPPKSVSVLWALGTAEQRAAIHQAHRDAVDAVVGYLEAQATFCRTRGERILTDGLVAAAFDHRTSRAGDPLLHTHVVVANLSRTVAGTWRALDGRPLYDHGISGGHLYQAYLRHLLTERLGVAWGPMRRGWAEVDGVPTAVIDLFSQRRDEIEEVLAESGYTSAQARQTATLATRQAKDYGVTADTLADEWRAEAAAAGFGAAEVAACFDRGAERPRRDDADVLRRLAGPAGITERSSTFTRRDVIRWLANDLAAGAPAELLERLADTFLASEAAVPLIVAGQRGQAQLVLDGDGRRIRTGGLATFTTPEVLEMEARLLQLADKACGAAAVHADFVADALQRRPELSDEQRAMVRAVAGSTASILPIVGRPGSGKTYATEACVAALRAGSVPTIGCAVSAAAAAELEQAAGLPSTTIASLLGRLDRGFDPLPLATAVIADEASMIGTRDLARLVDHVHAAGGRVVLVGDPDQHAAVDCGGVFRYLANRPAVLHLVENNRQHDPAERLAIDDYRRGRIDEALARYDEAGHVVRCATAGECHDAMVADWYVAWTRGEADPMIAGPNSTRRELNQRARRLLAAEGHLTGPTLTAAGREYRTGDLVVARRNDRSLHAPGSRAFVKNGSAGRINSVDVEAGDVVVDFEKEGRIRIPATYLAEGHLEHGYARTTYMTQGATHGTGRYHPTDAAGFEEGYVALTRARHQTRLYIVDGDQEISDETGHGRAEQIETGLDPVADAMSRRSANMTALELDPTAKQVADLAATHSEYELRRQREHLQAAVDQCPPSVAEEFVQARRGLDALQASGRRPWTAKALTASVERVRVLEAAHEEHQDFRSAHAADYEMIDILRRAESAVRLNTRLHAALEPLLADRAPDSCIERGRGVACVDEPDLAQW
jgi:conjugative relaxase-like TrwC/TraI family protein